MGTAPLSTMAAALGTTARGKRLAGCAMIRQNKYAMLTIKMLAHARNRIWVASIRANMGTSPVPHPAILLVIATMAELCLPTELCVRQSAASDWAAASLRPAGRACFRMDLIAIDSRAQRARLAQ